ncbi:MAG: deoxyribonuclease HsdR, partial [Muribaculaceae bacterium]|nr:deoxyribonuclease HsdR [Muribaculaceae bacterium]
IQGDVSSLGVVIKSLSADELKKLNRRSGVKVEKVNNGKFKNAGIRDGFIIYDINNINVNSADDVKKVYDSIVASDEYDHVMFITGKYPGQRKQYYAVDLD